MRLYSIGNVKVTLVIYFVLLACFKCKDKKDDDFDDFISDDLPSQPNINTTSNLSSIPSSTIKELNITKSNSVESNASKPVALSASESVVFDKKIEIPIVTQQPIVSNFEAAATSQLNRVESIDGPIEENEPNITRSEPNPINNKNNNELDKITTNKNVSVNNKNNETQTNNFKFRIESTNIQSKNNISEMTGEATQTQTVSLTDSSKTIESESPTIITSKENEVNYRKMNSEITIDSTNTNSNSSPELPTFTDSNTTQPSKLPPYEKPNYWTPMFTNHPTSTISLKTLAVTPNNTIPEANAQLSNPNSVEIRPQQVLTQKLPQMTEAPLQVEIVPKVLNQPIIRLGESLQESGLRITKKKQLRSQPLLGDAYYSYKQLPTESSFPNLSAQLSNIDIIKSPKELDECKH